MTTRRFFLQGAALTAVSLFLRVCHMGYRSYLTRQMGAQGMGLYQLILSVFLLTVTLSTSGISLAVTRMVTAALATHRESRVRSTVARCFAFCLSLSLSISLALFLGADAAAAAFLHDPQAAPCLRILGLGLPFMSLCTCMKGYFLAVEESLSTSVADLLEQLLTIGATVALFAWLGPKNIQGACFAAMLASTLGEAASFAVSWGLYRRSLGRHTPARREKAEGVLHGMTHIALPCTLSSAARSALNTGENLLIPRQLERFGLGAGAALGQYGLLQGMAMPMLYFPSSFLTGFASLLIPRLARDRELDRPRSVARVTEKALGATLLFGYFFGAVFAFFGETWGQLFYASEEAGSYLRVLAPLVPLLYLDVVTDSLLKGLDQQFNSMKYNFSDSLTRVTLVLLLLPRFGMDSYVLILFCSTTLNVSLSVHRLLKTADVRLSPLWHVALPLGWALLSVQPARLLFPPGSSPHPAMTLALQLLLSAGTYLPGAWLIASRRVASGVDRKKAAEQAHPRRDHSILHF